MTACPIKPSLARASSVQPSMYVTGCGKHKLEAQTQAGQLHSNRPV